MTLDVSWYARDFEDVPKASISEMCRQLLFPRCADSFCFRDAPTAFISEQLHRLSRSAGKFLGLCGTRAGAARSVWVLTQPPPTPRAGRSVSGTASAAKLGRFHFCFGAGTTLQPPLPTTTRPQPRSSAFERECA